MTAKLVLIKGAGDLATGVAHRLRRSGFSVVMTELSQPLVIRRTVAFAEAVYSGRTTVEGVTAVLTRPADATAVVADGLVAVIVDPDHPWVRVAAPESDAGAVAVGDSLEVRLPSGATTRGRVISKSVEAEFATQRDVSASKRDVRAVAFRVAIPNARRAVVPGMTASVVLPVSPSDPR